MMHVDGALTAGLSEVAGGVRELEELGVDGILTPESAHDPFLPLLLAAGENQRMTLISSIAVAFARSPMTLAQIGHDLNAYSRGRFVLGIGSQIRAHITRRYSMPWSSPARRMHELIRALHAIWDCWYDGKPLDFRGEFYQHTLMTPYFTPTDVEYGRPKVFLAAVGPRMTRVAGELADGLMLHVFMTPEYLQQVAFPNLEAGLARAGRSRGDIQISAPCLVVTGSDERTFAEAREHVRNQIAFYGSTPPYRGVLDSIGAGELHPALNALSKERRWQEMSKLIDDGMIEKFAVVAEPKDLAAGIRARFGDGVDRTTVAYPNLPRTVLVDVIAALRAG